MRLCVRWTLVVFVTGCGQRVDDAPGGDTQTTGHTSSTTDAPDDAAADNTGDDDAADDEFGEEFGEEPKPAWHCSGGGMGFFDSGPLTWASPAALTGGVTSWRVNGVDLDPTPYPAELPQIEHWGPCLMVDDGYVGVVLPMGPEVNGSDAQSQIRIGVFGGVGTYDLATTLMGAVLEDPTVYIGCTALLDGGYVGGPASSPGMTHVATGTLEVVSVPADDGEVLHVIADGTLGDGFCEFTLDVQLTAPEGYLGSL